MDKNIAILMPTHNDQKGLYVSLESLSNETEDFVCYIVDDGSIPPMSVPENLPFETILIRLDQNKGIAAALNIGLRTILSHGFTYIARLDADDTQLPGRLSAQKEFLSANPDYSVVGTAFDAVDDEENILYTVHPPTDHKKIKKTLQYKNCMLHPSVMFNADLLKGKLKYDETTTNSEDYEIFFRLSQFTKIGNLPNTFLKYRISPHSITATRKFRYAMRLRIQLRYFNFLSLHSYLGVLRTIILSLSPFTTPRQLRALRKISL